MFSGARNTLITGGTFSVYGNKAGATRVYRGEIVANLVSAA